MGRSVEARGCYTPVSHNRGRVEVEELTVLMIRGSGAGDTRNTSAEVDSTNTANKVDDLCGSRVPMIVYLSP